MVGAGIRSFAKFRGQMLWIAATGITSWQTILKWTADCQVPCSGCRGQVKPVAICSQIHTSVSGNPRDGYSILGNPRRLERRTHLSAELGKRLNSSYRNFPSRVPLFEASNHFAARLLEYKIPTPKNCLGLN
jgi:hypothetical protein